MIYITNPSITISSKELATIIKEWYEKSIPEKEKSYANFTPDFTTLRIEEGQRGDFTGISIKLIPKG